MKKTLFIVRAAMIGAIYASLTMLGAFAAYGPFQFRFSEVLTILPVFTTAAIPGLFIGCIIGNLGSPFGLIDIIMGSAATLISACLSFSLRKVKFFKLPLFSMLMPVIINSLLVGIVIVIGVENGPPDFSAFTIALYLTASLQVALGEAVMCIGLGIPFYLLLKKAKPTLWQI
ncbi:MAG: QueT transporter family protein [Clostridiales bacterium]|jgi:uncharacterized membrane protein|nr:QueT transporter family protein [Clostridiales bacterium]